MEVHPTNRVTPELPGSSSVSPVPPEQRAENRELILAVKAVNSSELLGYDSELAMFVDRETRKPVVRLVDKETKEVIRQIPAEHVLQMARYARELEQTSR